MNRVQKIMVVDDDDPLRALLRDYLVAEGYHVVAYSLATAALADLKLGAKIDLVISDLKMPQMDGLSFLEQVKKTTPQIPVVLMTAFGSIENAIEAIRKGAFDYMVKPFQLEEVSVIVARALNFKRLETENQVLRDQIKNRYQFQKIIGKSPGMKNIFDLIERVSQANSNVLITGESGTGKEMVARAIHESGGRRHKPFVAINCTSIPETLLESELFGHAKGAFTGAQVKRQGLFEEADGGTLFLDEIGDMEMGLQAKLLRVIQERKIRPLGENHFKEIDVRIIAATHKDLKEGVRLGTFREDLFYRLSVIPIVIPPLRHRKEDIPVLAENFLKKYAAINHSSVRQFSEKAMSKLIQHRWEGNVRELENLVERVIVLVNKPVIHAEDIPLYDANSVEDFFGTATSDLPAMEELEKRYIQFVLQKTEGRKEKAAHILGINRRTLYRKEREYDLLEPSSSQIDSAPLH